MRIDEISSQEFGLDIQHQSLSSPVPPSSSLHHQQDHLLTQIDSIVTLVEAKVTTPTTSLLSTTLSSDLRQTLARLSHLLPLTNSQKLAIWKFSYRLWNACVDISNATSLLSSPSTSITSLNVALRHIAADMLSLVANVSGVPSPAVKTACFYHKTGLLYHDSLKDLDSASSCFEKATEIISKTDPKSISDPAERHLLLEINLARARTAWESTDRNLAVTLLNRCKLNLLFDSPDHYKLTSILYLDFGKSSLSTNKEEINSNQMNEALKLINEALDLCEKGMSLSRIRDQTMDLKELRSKALRFIAAVHLQREEFESVIKCVKVLRDDSNSKGGSNHPSLPVLAMKAWLGLGRYAEAEKELSSMVVNKGVPEEVWVGAVEDYFESAGTTGAETAKSVFLELLNRCHVSASSALRVVLRLLSGSHEGEGWRVKVKVLIEIVSDQRVLSLFENAKKERTAIHAAIWDCASEHFKHKDYRTSSELFEKSLLYTPNNIENRTLRAKAFRVLCLCHLALSQLDRAQEYVHEADKLDPNISSSFLKYKIHLQNNNQNGAVSQIQSMRKCHDFSPEFLLLSSHEAIACNAFPVAVSALTDLLQFHHSGKPIPVREVIILRTLTTMLSQEESNESSILNFTKLARSRWSELGNENFFGEGDAGTRERNWFATMSWNAAVNCGKQSKFEVAADFFHLASDFFEQSDQTAACKSLLLTVCSTAATPAPVPEARLRHSAELLQKAETMLTSADVGLEPELHFMYTYIAYDMTRRNDGASASQQLQLVRSYARSKACRAENLVQLGMMACEGARANKEAARYALSECLTAALSRDVADYDTAAVVVRKMIGVGSAYEGDAEDEEVYGMYRQAYRIMVGLKGSEYPEEEGKWLAMTAWNRAAMPVRLGLLDLGKKWMALAMDIARNVAPMEPYVAYMDGLLSKFH